MAPSLPFVATWTSPSCLQRIVKFESTTTQQPIFGFVVGFSNSTILCRQLVEALKLPIPYLQTVRLGLPSFNLIKNEPIYTDETEPNPVALVASSSSSSSSSIKVSSYEVVVVAST